MRRYLPFIIVVAVGLIMLGSAIKLYLAKRPAVLTITKNEKEPGEQADSVHSRGNPKAPVTLEEFGDFECPPCGKLSEPINQLEKDFQPNLRLIFRHFPLVNHAHAREAALAAEAAGLQGRFWEMHDLLYREQAVWSKVADARTLFNSYAGILGLNLDQFKKDMDSDQVKTRVAADQKYGTSIGVQNTPTLFLNNRAIDPKSLNPESLRAAVEAAGQGEAVVLKKDRQVVSARIRTIIYTVAAVISPRGRGRSNLPDRTLSHRRDGDLRRFGQLLRSARQQLRQNPWHPGRRLRSARLLLRLQLRYVLAAFGYARAKILYHYRVGDVPGHPLAAVRASFSAPCLLPVLFVLRRHDFLSYRCGCGHAIFLIRDETKRVSRSYENKLWRSKLDGCGRFGVVGFNLIRFASAVKTRGHTTSSSDGETAVE